MTFHLPNHQSFVGACEQLAHDIVRFEANPYRGFEIVTHSEIPQSTLTWIEKVKVSEG